MHAHKAMWMQCHVFLCSTLRHKPYIINSLRAKIFSACAVSGLNWFSIHICLSHTWRFVQAVVCKYAAVTGVCLTGIDMENCHSNVKSMHMYGVVQLFIVFKTLFLITINVIITISLTPLTFKGGCLWVAVAVASGEMYEHPLSLLGLSHQWKSL